MEAISQAVASFTKAQNILNMLTYLNLAAYLWPQPANMNIKGGESFDFLIVGGGTAGCIVASNLAQMNVSVLVIEAGCQPTIDTEIAGLFPLSKNRNFDWNFTTVEDSTKKYHRGGVTEVEQGKVLGGSSILNYMIYGTGNCKDYKDWANITNDSSWTYDSIFPLIKRTEKVIDRRILQSSDVAYHGTQGKIALKKYHSSTNDGFYESYKEMGYKVLNDINVNNPLGFTPAYFTISDSIRQSTAYGFIRPEKDNPNLKVMYRSLVTKVLFDDNKRAIGVEVLTKDRKTITLYANKEVIVTAGPFKSPQLLMLSGIGPQEHLESNEIEVISNVPVGQNLQDHPTNIIIHKLGVVQPVSPRDPHQFPVNVMDGRVAINKCQNYADYQVLSGVMTNSTLFLEICLFTFTFTNEVCARILEQTANHQVHFITHRLLYPESRGEVRLNSTNPEDSPVIDPKYYTNENDLERHAEYIEHYNKIVDTSYYKRLNASFVDPKLESCDGLEVGSKAYWKCYTIGMSTTLHDYVGTCAMGSVVDSKLRVNGVKNLRVADSSVIPKIIGSSVQGAVMVIAQKVSDLLQKEYGL
ncbi:glucose dehydrogenase [FAD, quinone]-like [Spodoptera litura]|uniref:Glucose dehydrogenase [FAD, quinone]-like n=1 Tax=Spodoptera litura TaxID=69820 RepID=A0A9J7DXJ6_SPOLT|nr:glucose dehydrogenase [FAD, quinone]-like [Spodoptera litura]